MCLVLAIDWWLLIDRCAGIHLPVVELFLGLTLHNGRGLSDCLVILVIVVEIETVCCSVKLLNSPLAVLVVLNILQLLHFENLP